jgi:hypothetical protein
VARRVAEEQGTEIGRGVGYAVRFEERSSPETRIKYLTGEHVCRLADPSSAESVSAHGEQCRGCMAEDMGSHAAMASCGGPARVTGVQQHVGSESRGCHDCPLLCRDTGCMTAEAVPVQTARCCGSAWRMRGWGATRCWCWTRRTSAASTPTSCSACSRAWCTDGGHAGAQPGSDCETAERRADRAVLCSWEPGQE